MSMGIIVINESLGEPVSLFMRDNATWKGIPPGGVLLSNKTATVFPDRGSARAAIKRTKEYFRQCGLPGEHNEYGLWILKPKP